MTETDTMQGVEAVINSDARWSWQRIGTLLVVGVAIVLFAMLLWRFDPSAVVGRLGGLGWKVVLIFFPYALVAACDTLGWWFAFPAPGCPLHFSILFRLRLAAKTVHDLTPVFLMAGEITKIHLLRMRDLPWGPTVASVITAKITIILAEVLFVLIGLSAVLVEVPTAATHTLLTGAGAGLVLMLIALGRTLLWQRSGLCQPLVSLGKRTGVLSEAGGGVEETLRGIDVLLMESVGRHAVRFWSSSFWHFLGWAAGAVEVWILLALLGSPVDPVSALMIEALLLIVQGLTGFLPTNLGTLESGAIATFVWLGLPAPDALALILVRRLRQLGWMAAGMGFLAQMIQPDTVIARES